MRRHLTAIVPVGVLSLTVFLTSCADTASTGAAAPDVEMEAVSSEECAAGAEEGSVTWYTAHYNSETAEAIAGLFEDTYPDIGVDLYRQTAQRLYQRFTQEEAAGQTVADLLGITETGLVETLAEKGLLAKYMPPNMEGVKDDYAKYNDPEGFYHVGAVGNNVITYNTDALTEEEAPHTWEELLDPKWQGKIATGHPGASGYVGTWATQMYLKYGPDYITKLADQDVLVGQSINDTIPRLAAGERIVAAGSDQTTAVAIAAGDPIGIIYPEDGAVIMPTPNAITAGAPHPNAAKCLANFIISEQVQTYLAENEFATPLVDGVPLPDHVPAEATYMRPELAELTENLEPVISLWRQEFGV
jgi:iron(III) transport system substrate-binding protein